MQREVLQILEGWKRAGLTSLRKIPPRAAATASRAAVSESPAAVARSAEPAAALFPATRETVAPEVSMPRKSASVALALQPARCQTFTPLELPRAERIERLTVLQKSVAACTRCDELARTRKQTVFGVGNPEAKIVFIGEAPGADEDAQGEPFVGRAGKLLNDIITACRLRREDIYICNILRCRPPGNRLPSLPEAENCREWLDGQLAVVNPDYIVCWGSCAARNLLGSEETIGKLRGRFFNYGRAKVLCTYHPSYLLRNPAAKKDVWEDMKLLFRDMGVDITAKK